MIHTSKNNRYLNFNSPLINYIRDNYSYNNENLIYTKKYTNGTFSITNPTSKYKNCRFINGYPHFNIPLEICIDEIYYFLDNMNMYDYKFNIRYGDTHPHKPIPKLAQIRNLLIENCLSSMIGKNCKSYYGIGDISIKTLRDFISNNSMGISPDELFVKIVNNSLESELEKELLEYDDIAILKISEFLKNLGLNQKHFLVESSLYKNNELYNKFKRNPIYYEELKDNGELKYSLQEMMFIHSILENRNDILINIIGANQTEHVIKVINIIRQSESKLDNRFLTYNICKNGDERDFGKWNDIITEFIIKNNLKMFEKYIKVTDLLKIIIIITSNDIIIDFNKMDKYINDINRFINIIEKNIDSSQINCYNVNCNNDLICKMALVGYNLNRSIEMGNQNNFYRYLLSVINEYESNIEKYTSISYLYNKFVKECIVRLGYNFECQKEKVLIR